MRKLSLVTLTLSLLFHCILFIIIPYSTKATQPLLQAPDFEIHLSAPKIIKYKKTHSKSKLRTQFNDKNLAIKNLSPESFYIPTLPSQASKREQQELAWKGQEGDVNETMNEMSLSEYSENKLFFDQIQLKIDQTILYPQDLVKHNIQGQTWVKLILNRKGQLLKIINSSTKNPLLKTYTLIGAHQALKNPLPKKIGIVPSGTSLYFFILILEFTLLVINKVASLPIIIKTVLTF